MIMVRAKNRLKTRNFKFVLFGILDSRTVVAVNILVLLDLSLAEKRSIVSEVMNTYCSLVGCCTS